MSKHASTSAAASFDHSSVASSATATQLVEALQKHASKTAKPLVHGSAYSIPLQHNRPHPDSNTKASTPRTSECILTSWKVSEFAYRKVEVVSLEEDADIPTLARGLFTAAADMESEGKGETKRERIVARGYDKFFNVDEMRWTKRPSLEAHSTAPYLLTFKENGCIILISALTPDQLVVCSKHSVGDRDNVELSHAKAGEAWVDRHLERVGRKRQELAKELWDRRCTAVAELCDDSFEEHVLAYAPSRTGLHLHGLNHNTVHFSTEPMDVVASFAQAWGFIPPRWKTFHSLKTLFAFTDQVSETGSWEGEAIEGFVVRTSMPLATHRSITTTTTTTTTPPSALPTILSKPPYNPGQAWFFKIKFEEPYLMYRDWRELTRTMIRSQKKWAQENKFDLDDALSGKWKDLHVEAAEDASEILEEVGPKQQDEVDDAEQPQDVAGEEELEEATSTSDAELSKKARKKAAKKARKKAEKADPSLKQKRRIKPGQAIPHPSASWAHLPHPPPERPQKRQKRRETMLYMDWVWEKLYGKEDGSALPDRGVFEGYAENRGIVASREAFLRYLNSEEGKKRLGELDPGSERKTLERGKRSMDERPFTHTVVVPVAVPGCGKTILSIALADLLSQTVADSQTDDMSSSTKGAALDTPLRVSHVQADNMTTKKTGPAFLQAVTVELNEGKNVVIADRNNHLLKHRRELVDEVRKWEEKVHKTSLDKARGQAQKQKKRGSAAPLAAKNDVLRDEIAAPRVRLVALPWDLDDLALNAVHRLCSDRITQRGDNHQSLRADPQGASGSSDHEGVLWRFLDDWQSFQAGPLDDTVADEADLAFDESIRMGVDAEEEGNLKQAFEAISQILEVRFGDAQLGPEGKSRRIHDALKRAKEYKVDVLKPARAIHSQVARSQAPSKAPRYYGISVELNSFTALKQRLARHASTSALHAEALDMLEKLHRDNRIVKTPHITLVHSSDLHKNQGAEESAKSEAARRKWKRYEELCSGGGSGGGTGSSAGVAADAPDSQRIRKSPPPPDFDIVLDRLAWQSGRAMAFGVCKAGKGRLFSADMPDFEEVQCGLRIASSVMMPEERRGDKEEDGAGRASSKSTTTTTIMQDWTPHVTVGTANESIRPFEAHAVLREADENEKKKERRREERCKVLYLGGEESIRIRGRLQGMNR
ncbi:hypothetical protein IE81DRAFT_369099 [Ceraceosorus guamensis]|uniref:tRNA ligase phosphodiesterase domain-containing protein n=1 Tax=Ceraceosorus guamensis TaxID=1522189 RepID=A0A316VSN4_9BASI|nr:hypothetical protein IE81DRAFT_369099 [Ceraceosorus guamensis]PWN39423.1 hypothetical protein IE81DRAFT_369099 [Ceraceosorus guamensis]